MKIEQGVKLTFIVDTLYMIYLLLLWCVVHMIYLLNYLMKQILNQKKMHYLVGLTRTLSLGKKTSLHGYATIYAFRADRKLCLRV